MCECFAGSIVEETSWGTLSVTELKLNQGKELGAVLEELASEEMVVYAAICSVK